MIVLFGHSTVQVPAERTLKEIESLDSTGSNYNASQLLKRGLHCAITKQTTWVTHRLRLPRSSSRRWSWRIIEMVILVTIILLVIRITVAASIIPIPEILVIIIYNKKRQQTSPILATEKENQSKVLLAYLFFFLRCNEKQNTMPGKEK